MKYVIVLTLLTLAACQPKTSVLSDDSTAIELPDQWYQGKAEVSTYELTQNRYNSTHPGKMVTIFVTEDFLTDKQVKNDSGRSKNSTGVLKMNKIRRFTTGLYDYSLFTSTFTDMKKAKTYKVTASSQDWCGQSYMQVNRDKSKYKVEVRSYFEGESDDLTIQSHVLEDELPLLIRLDDNLLPTGSFELLPSLEYARLRHIPYAPLSATADFSTVDVGEYGWSEKVKKYTVSIPSQQRTLTYLYIDDSTRQIVMWEDSYPSAFDKQMRTTTATIIHSEWTPYWSENSASDRGKRSNYSLSDF